MTIDTSKEQYRLEEGTDIYRTLRRDINAALYPKGMSVHSGKFVARIDLVTALLRDRDRLISRISDYEEVITDHRRLVRELDILLNGEEGAAKQASLCDIVAQVARQKREQMK